MNVGDAYRRTDSKNSPPPNLYTTYPAGYPIMQYSYPPVSYFYPPYGYEIPPYMAPQFIPYYADPYAGYYPPGAPYSNSDDNNSEEPAEYLDGLTEQLADLHIQKNENDPTTESKLVPQAQ